MRIIIFLLLLLCVSVSVFGQTPTGDTKVAEALSEMVNDDGKGFDQISFADGSEQDTAFTGSVATGWVETETEVSTLKDVGIGTTTTTQKLTIAGDISIGGHALGETTGDAFFDSGLKSPTLFLNNNSGIYFGSEFSNDVGYLYSYSNDILELYSGFNDVRIGSYWSTVFFNGTGTTLVEIANNGNVGIGKAAPTTRLELSQDADLILRMRSYETTPRSIIDFGSSRGTAVSPTATQSGDVLGRLNFKGNRDTTPTFNSSARIDAIATENFSGTSTGGKLTFSTTGNTTATLEKRMVIDQSGNVGIGTTVPSNILTLPIASVTDPIADSWTVHPSDSKHKTLISSSPGLSRECYKNLRNSEIRSWKRKPFVTQEEIKNKVFEDFSPVISDVEIAAFRLSDGTETTTVEVRGKIKDQKWGELSELDRENMERGKGVELRTAKSLLPKFSKINVGVFIDDITAPREIMTLDETGIPAGIDLLSYCGFLHAALREAIEEIERIKLVLQ